MFTAINSLHIIVSIASGSQILQDVAIRTCVCDILPHLSADVLPDNLLTVKSFVYVLAHMQAKQG
jgi:hypothetical protein